LNAKLPDGGQIVNPKRRKFLTVQLIDPGATDAEFPQAIGNTALMEQACRWHGTCEMTHERTNNGREHENEQKQSRFPIRGRVEFRVGNLQIKQACSGGVLGAVEPPLSDH
jgi:hypothetical protein